MCLFLDKTNTQLYEDLKQFFATKQGFLASKKYRKYSFKYNDYNVYLAKVKSRTLSLFTKNAEI